MFSEEAAKELVAAGYDYARDNFHRHERDLLGSCHDLAQAFVEDFADVEVAADYVAEGIRKAFAEKSPS